MRYILQEGLWYQKTTWVKCTLYGTHSTTTVGFVFHVRSYNVHTVTKSQRPSIGGINHFQWKIHFKVILFHFGFSLKIDSNIMFQTSHLLDGWWISELRIQWRISKLAPINDFWDLVTVFGADARLVTTTVWSWPSNC